jgi:ABC-type iron transport system FetAB permease component
VITEEIDIVPSAPDAAVGIHQAPRNSLPEPAQQALTLGLLISALRCTVQYVLLPFVLPWIGFATSISSWITLVLGGVALASLTRNARYLWRLQHARRWSYLAFASVVATALVLFMAIDLHNVLGV